MTKGLIGGMTDYRHQSFLDIITDLTKERDNAISFRDNIKSNVNTLKSNSYWNNVPYDFKNIIAYSIKHFDNAISEFEDMIIDLNIEVKEHHVIRLRRIAEVAQEINTKIGEIWHQKYLSKDFGNTNFELVETLYCDSRDMAVNLLDVDNIAERLNDYIGKIKPIMKKNNPWISGSFYLVLVVAIITLLAIVSNMVNWALFPLILIGGILLTSLIGIIQLRNDNRISDKSYQSLLIETYKRLPLIKLTKSKSENN